MLYILILTPRCNSNCRYCGGFEEGIMPEKIQYGIEDLKEFVGEASIAFYGGEPLLEINKMKEIMDKIKAERFILQTNGILLDQIDESYLKKFSTILVSFDGREGVHELYRGNYEKVLKNARRIKGYCGELIARMTASLDTDIYEDVMHILSLDTFTHVHWQIDAVWSKFTLREFEKWVEKYNEGVRKLVKFWINEILAGRIHRIVPFMGVATALFESYPYPPCASGFESFAISTDGRVLACPICPDLDWNCLGDIYSGIKKSLEVLDPCPRCNYFRFCGGRCLFFNRERFWGDEGFKLVCSTVKNLVDSLLAYKDQLAKYKEQIKYPKFLNTTEIIP
ncbi:MAG: TIGR04084 family radical SAM/SPASM domain-containing protein [Archaeoglobaceae archaeon]|nr:TIGR04084 family radical SAM/SPASM domain-containing protein [Archaeoglobaceae archaeon]MDW8117858.1 TIGR04084 family radical SAM/SPASM domain-containing protein [Archaeoglobaceae archaeon]